MSSKLWFLTDGIATLSVFVDRSDAERELSKYQDDPDYQYYSTFDVFIDDLEDYPDEYDMALNEGLI